MYDASVYPRSKTVRAAVAVARHDRVERLGFVFASGLLSAATILFVASVILGHIG